MYAPGHFGIAAALYAPVTAALVARDRVRLALAGGACVLCASVVPDADELVPGIAHRGPTHTIWFAAIVGLVAAVPIDRYGRRHENSAVASEHGLLLGGLSAGSIVGHLAGDLVTPMGIRPFAPLTDAHYTLDLVPSRDPGTNSALFAAGSAATAVAVALGRVFRAEPVTSRPRAPIRAVLALVRSR